MEYINSIAHSHAVLLSASILLVAYIFIATEKISKVTVALIGACLTVALGLLSQQKYDGDSINPLYFVNFIDFNVIFLLISMMIIVSITAKSGVFNFLATHLLGLTRGRPVAVLITLGLFTGFVSAFLDNVTTVILVMPITFAIAKKLEISPMPFLISEVFASNIGGTATLIGDPPNIIIGSAGNLSFSDFICVLTPIVVIILFTVLAILSFLFRKDLKASPEKMAALMDTAQGDTITNRSLMIRSVFVLCLVVLGFLSHTAIGLETSVVALCGASILLLFEKPAEIFKEVEWNTIFFFIGLFIIVGGLEASGGIKMMANFLMDITKGSQEATSMIVLWASGMISGVIDNIPYTATMAPMILEIEKVLGREYANPLWWSLSLGACLGGNMTIIGAAANVIVSERAAQNGWKISFMFFLKYGVLVTLISLALSAAYLYLRFFL